jgi:hypothetical protein
MARIEPLGIHEVDGEFWHLCEEAGRQSGTSASTIRRRPPRPRSRTPPPAEMEPLDRIEARVEDTSPLGQTVPLPGSIEEGRRRHTEVQHDAHRRGLRLLLP